MTSSILRWALIGASDIAATRMMPAMRAVGHDVVGVASNSAERGAAYATANDLPYATTDLDELVSRDDRRGVRLQHQRARTAATSTAAARAGKHILCEKPLATSVDDADAMVEAAGRAGVVLAVNHHLPGADTHARSAAWSARAR